MWLNERFKIEQLLGKGGFSRVYRAFDKEKDKRVALKLDMGVGSAGNRSLLQYEAKVMKLLRGTPGVPDIYWDGQTNHKGKNYDIMVIDLLGMDLEAILEKRSGMLTFLEASHLCLSLTSTLEQIHNRGFVHRDIKPANIMLGFENDNNVYIADFGLAKKYLNSDGSHISYNEKKSGVTGTLRFCSVHTHNCEESSRRDDMESLMYVFIAMVKGKLIWQGLKERNKIGTLKMETPISQICENCPPQVADMLTYVRNLDFSTKPDYDRMKAGFKEIIRLSRLGA